ncbi:MAG: hypothetical protein KJO79_08790, partial [Verrucomicrobiae bacterium]|nr:hypothetical protein [Verrucomicrobiae bacterium]NNJ87264.1 hypothetical protein [Akkermansiaceae bacterium]
SKTHQILKTVATRFDGPGERVTVRISNTPEGLKRRQFNLNRVLAVGWVLNKPESFEDDWVKPLSEMEKGDDDEKLHAPRGSFN